MKTARNNAFLFPRWTSAFFFGIALTTTAQAQETETDSSASVQEWLRWGPVNLRPRGSAAVIYDDNVTLAPTNELSDVYWSFSPGISVMAGDKQTGETAWMSVDYDANIMVFHEHSEFNDLNHALGAEALWPMAKLSLGATVGYDLLSTPLIYSATRVDRSLYRFGLSAKYQYSEKTSFEVNGSYNESDYGEELIGSKEWSNDNWVNYQYSEKLNVGLGATFGYLEPGTGPSQKFQRASLRANYTLTYKLAVDASAGAEFRQYDGFPSSVTPVFSLGATYRPVDRTTIRLSGHRREQSSVTVVNANQITTGVSLNVRQQIWDRIGVSVGGSYENSEYRTVQRADEADVTAPEPPGSDPAPTPRNNSSNRSDDYFAINVGVDVVLTPRWNAALTAQHRENSSDSSSGIVFEANQVSLQTSYTF